MIFHKLTRIFFVLQYPILKSFLAGSFSGTFSTILFQPLDLVKTRLQNTANTRKHGAPRHPMLTTVIHIIRKENIFGLWKGMTPVNSTIKLIAQGNN